MNITLLQYYRGFKSLYGALAAIPFVPPLVHIFAPDTGKLAYLYPPLGDMQVLALAVTLLLLLWVTFRVFRWCQSAQKVRRAPWSASWPVGAILAFCVLFGVWGGFVVRVAVPSVNQEVLVSIGYQRTDFALTTYPKWSDSEMLHDRGPTEETVKKLWTPLSVSIVRLVLWLTYTTMLACLLVEFCVAVYQHASVVAETESRSRKSQPEERSNST